MEKVIVIIGRLTKAPFLLSRTNQDDRNWLQDTFEISPGRAATLVATMNQDTMGTSQRVTVALDYRQLARYTVRRNVEKLTRYWKYPKVLEHIEEDDPKEELHPIELRPYFRRQ